MARSRKAAGKPPRKAAAKDSAGKRRIEQYDHKSQQRINNPPVGDTGRIALWALDPDYDGRSLFPRQVFFPMAGDAGGSARLARNLKAEIDADRIEAYRGTVSLPFEPGVHKRVAVKIVDDRGIESLKIIATP